MSEFILGEFGNAVVSPTHRPGAVKNPPPGLVKSANYQGTGAIAIASPLVTNPPVKTATVPRLITPVSVIPTRTIVSPAVPVTVASRSAATPTGQGGAVLNAPAPGVQTIPSAPSQVTSTTINTSTNTAQGVNFLTNPQNPNVFWGIIIGGIILLVLFHKDL